MVQRVAATTQRAEQVPIGELELGAGPVLPGTQAALVGGSGGAEVWLDGEQMGVVCGIKTDSGNGNGMALSGRPLMWRPQAGVLGARAPHLLCWA